MTSWAELGLPEPTILGPLPVEPLPVEQCDSYPEGQGCECDRPAGHVGSHRCVCGAEW